MKLIRCLLWLVVLGAGIQLHAQPDLLAEREAGLGDLSGSAYVAEALALSDAYYSARQLRKAVELARLGYGEASKTGDEAGMAQTLNREAKALLASQRVRSKEGLGIIRKLEESNTLTTSTDLRLENLKILRQVYAQLGKANEARETQRQIAQLITAENRKLEEELVRASEEWEETIETMTENQAKSELLLAQQKSISDSLAFLGTIDSLKLAQQSIELSEKEATLRERTAQQRFLLALSGLGVLLLLGLFLRFRAVRRHNRAIAKEKKRSDELLLNILPQKVAEELKTNRKVEAQFFENASVLFVDFEGFSQFAAGIAPNELVATLDYCFKKFDRIIGKYGLEKIKTIGDAYMAAGGLPSPDPSNPRQVVNAALDIKDFLKSWKKACKEEGKPFLLARIGVHTGSLVAGVVGEKKFAYDIWGDTVNIAARMESSGQSGKVNISATTYEAIKDEFVCKRRGKIPTKNLGDMEMYFVEGKK